jgi:hypothetical protein
LTGFNTFAAQITNLDFKTRIILNSKDLVFPAFILILSACGQTSATETPPGSGNKPSAKWVIDTAKVNAILAVKDSMISGVDNLIQTGQAHAPIVEGTNGFGFYELDGGRLALKGSFSSKEAEIRIGPFMMDGKLAYVEFRDFHKTGEPYGKEMYLYFENGKIFYAGERTVPLDPGQDPVAILTVPLLARTRTSEDLTAGYGPYFEQTMKAVEPHLSH